jgi:hypothetical protein
MHSTRVPFRLPILKSVILPMAVGAIGFGLAGCGSKNGGDIETARAEIRRNTVETAAARAMELVKPEDVAATYGIPFPPKLPPSAMSEVKTEVDKRVQDELNVRYPLDRMAEIKREIEERFKPYKIGDEVVIVLHGGVGPRSRVQGAFTGISDTHVKIGSAWILKQDMDEEDLARFDAKIRDKLFETHYRRQLVVFKSQRETVMTELMDEYLPQAMKEAGYILWNGTWVSPAELLDRAVERERTRVAKELQPQIEETLFHDAGYVFKEGEWQPSLMKKLKDLF